MTNLNIAFMKQRGTKKNISVTLSCSVFAVLIVLTIIYFAVIPCVLFSVCMYIYVSVWVCTVECVCLHVCVCTVNRKNR